MQRVGRTAISGLPLRMAQAHIFDCLTNPVAHAAKADVPAHRRVACHAHCAQFLHMSGAHAAVAHAHEASAGARYRRQPSASSLHCGSAALQHCSSRRGGAIALQHVAPAPAPLARSISAALAAVRRSHVSYSSDGWARNSGILTSERLGMAAVHSDLDCASL